MLDAEGAFKTLPFRDGLGAFFWQPALRAGLKHTAVDRPTANRRPLLSY
jgi:hypothetical protein